MQSERLTEQLAIARPRKHFARRFIRRSSVAVVLDSDRFSTASLLLIQRAQHEQDPWSGHMAFPGGRWEKGDRNGLATAKREMHEEVGIDVDRIDSGQRIARVVGRLSDISAKRRVIRQKMIVTPYVFLANQRPVVVPNYEVADTVWIPLQYFADPENRESKQIAHNGNTFQLPCYNYGADQVVWGMTLAMIDELLGIMGRPMPGF